MLTENNRWHTQTNDKHCIVYCLFQTTDSRMSRFDDKVKSNSGGKSYQVGAFAEQIRQITLKGEVKLIF